MQNFLEIAKTDFTDTFSGAWIFPMLLIGILWILWQEKDWMRKLLLGILPLVFEDPADYDRIRQGDVLTLSDIFEGLKENRVILHAGEKEIPLRMELAERQKEMLLAGGLLKYAAATGKQR